MYKINYTILQGTIWYREHKKSLLHCISNYNESLTNHIVSELFNIHPNYINDQMVMHTGLSLHKYIISLRISKAIGMLETTNMQITEIAYNVEFKNM